MNLENQIKFALNERGGRQIKLTQSEYDQNQHELCSGIAGMLWGDKGLVESLGQTWLMVMDPRFTACEKAWYKKQRITGSATRGENSFTEYGVVTVTDQGDLESPRMMSLEQYAEIIGEGRHFVKVIRDKWTNDPNPEAADVLVRHYHGVADTEMLGLIRQECPNYFTREGKPNELARTMLEMLKADWLGLILDYCEVGNIDQWVFVETGDVAHDTERADPDHPIAHAEIEYLDRSLTYRSILRANAIKVLSKLGGEKMASEFAKVTLTEFEKDEIMKEVFAQKYDELYKAQPAVLHILQTAQQQTFEHRERVQLGMFRQFAQEGIKRIKSGEQKPLDLLDGADYESEAEAFKRIQHDDNLKTLFYVELQALEMVKDYPGFQEVLDLVKPYLEAAEPVGGKEFEDLLEQIQDAANRATGDKSVGTHE